jgi:hypothetical protein
MAAMVSKLCRGLSRALWRVADRLRVCPACCRRPYARAGAQAFELWSVPGQRDPLVRVLYNREELPLDDLPAGARHLCSP